MRCAGRIFVMIWLAYVLLYTLIYIFTGEVTV